MGGGIVLQNVADETRRQGLRGPAVIEPAVDVFSGHLQNLDSFEFRLNRRLRVVDSGTYAMGHLAHVLKAVPRVSRH